MAEWWHYLIIVPMLMESSFTNFRLLEDHKIAEVANFIVTVASAGDENWKWKLTAMCSVAVHTTFPNLVLTRRACQTDG